MTMYFLIVNMYVPVHMVVFKYAPFMFYFMFVRFIKLNGSCTSENTYICVSVCMFVCVSVGMLVCMYVSLCVCVYVSLCVC